MRREGVIIDAVLHWQGGDHTAPRGSLTGCGYYPQMLDIADDLGADWFLDLWDAAPTPK
jgi:hypothetical protein